jgi:hypothetical protein
VAGAKSGDLINTLLGRSTDGGATWSEAQLSTHGSNFRWEAHGARRVGFWGDYIYVSAVPAQSPRCEPTGTTSCPAWTHEPTGPDRFDVYQLCTNVPDDINSASYSPRESPTRMFDLGLLNQSIYIDWSCVRALAPAASRAAGERRSGRSKTPSAAQDNTAAQATADRSSWTEDQLAPAVKRYHTCIHWEPTPGLEPGTARLQVECAANCATPAMP